MALATWWKADPLSDLTPLAGFTVRLAGDAAEMPGSIILRLKKCENGFRPDTAPTWAISAVQR